MLITLTTDFGYKDPFVGVMKGTVLSINPQAGIVDITHGITPHNVREAALTVADSYRYFPPVSIHVVVVDPGVGSGRRPILVVTDEHYFVGPDNGVFTPVFDEALNVLHITAEHYFLPKRGSTFHGRDIFAPVAAWLSKGISVSNFGEPITDYVTIELPLPGVGETSIEGEVIFMDHFGNAATNIRQKDIDTLYSRDPSRRIEISVHDKPAQLRNFYSEAEGTKRLSAVINSSGYLEFFVFKGSATKEFNINVADRVRVTLRTN